MTTNPRSLAVRYDEAGNVTWLICESCVEWTEYADLYVDAAGDRWDICRWCGTGTQRPHVMLELKGPQVYLSSSMNPGLIEAVEADELDNLLPEELLDVLNTTEVWRGTRDDDKPLFTALTFDLTSNVGQVPCHECGGTGWWGFGPTEVHGQCVDCKGTGREWVGLW